MKKFIIAGLFVTATCFANWGYESRSTLERIAASLEKIERHLAKNCETPKATPASHIDYTYDARNTNHPLKAKATYKSDDEGLQRCVDKCDNLYDKDEDRLTECLQDCIDRY